MALQAAGMCSAGAADRLVRRDIGIWTPLTSTVPFSDWRRAAAKGGRPDLFGLRMKVLKDEKSSCSLPPSNPAWELPLWNLDTNLLTKPLSITDRSVCDHGSNFRIAYQGAPGAFSEAAALKAYPHCEAVPCEHFEVTFEAVELWLVDKAILPIENSLHGSYHKNYDLLLQHGLHIVREVQIPVDHCLMALPGVSKKDLKRVVSHPQALGQCENSLSKLGVTKESFHDTAGAAQIASKGLRDAGAIASAQAAKLYGLHILQHKMQDACNNVTRFLVLAREPIIPLKDRPFKTSIVFILEDGPGALFKALAVFVLRSINLSKIESRPQRKQPIRVVDDSDHGTAKYFHCFFYIDFEASMAEPRAQSALTNLQEFVSFLRVLGSFPMDTTL